MKITINNPRLTMTAINRELDKNECILLGRRIEKYILRSHSIVCDIEVK